MRPDSIPTANNGDSVLFFSSTHCVEKENNPPALAPTGTFNAAHSVKSVVQDTDLKKTAVAAAVEKFANRDPAPLSLQDARYHKMLVAADAAELHQEYAKLCEHWKEIKSPLANSGYRKVISKTLEDLIEKLSDQPDPLLEEEFLEGGHELQKISDFVKLNTKTFPSIFDQVLRKKYQQAHADFRKALQQYLVCREIVRLKLPQSSLKEETLLIDVLEQKKSTLDQTVASF